MSTEVGIEVWRPVVGYERIYEVSNCGRVRSSARQNSRKRLKPAKIRALMVNKWGYRMVGLRKDRYTKLTSVARIVAFAFIPNPMGFPQVNHINGEKEDNRVENLEWCSAAENTRHAWSHGLCKKQRGERNASSKLNDGIVADIKRLHKEGVKQSEIARRFDIHQTNVHYIVSGKTWSHVL